MDFTLDYRKESVSLSVILLNFDTLMMKVMNHCNCLRNYWLFDRNSRGSRLISKSLFGVATMTFSELDYLTYEPVTDDTILCMK